MLCKCPADPLLRLAPALSGREVAGDGNVALARVDLVLGAKQQLEKFIEAERLIGARLNVPLVPRQNGPLKIVVPAGLGARSEIRVKTGVRDLQCG